MLQEVNGNIRYSADKGGDFSNASLPAVVPITISLIVATTPKVKNKIPSI